jgi:two-component system cell cycle response regulator
LSGTGPGGPRSLPPTSTSTPPRARHRRVAHAVKRKAPLDAFADEPLARVGARRPRRAFVPSAASLVSATCAAFLALGVVVDVRVGALGVAAACVAAGALLSRTALVRFVVAAAVGVALAVVGAALGAGNALGVDVVVDAAFAVVGVVVLAALPRLTVAFAASGARRTEQARADAEVLGLLDDARLFRRLGRADADVDADEPADAALLRDVGCAVAQRDRLYRLLRLCERSLKDSAVVALYVVDDSGAGLRLVEQLAQLDAQNKPRLPLGGRGVGPAGLVGLCVTRRAPVRVVEQEPSAALQAHRHSGEAPKSALCVPLLSRGGGVRGVVVVDRVEAVAFDADDEAFVVALGEEVLDGLAGEELITALDAERRRVGRVYAAARTLAGVTRTADVVDVAVAALKELGGAVAVVDVDAGSGGARVLAADGVLKTLAGGAVDGSSFVGRALAERTALPHTALAQAQRRALLRDDDGVDVATLVDVRVVPLVAHGVARGVVIVAGDRFGRAVTDAIVAVADVVALALAAAQSFDAVEKQATTDGLTGVANRRALDRRLEEAIARARRSGQPLAVMLTDVDHFKSVNDTWGHSTGDDVLKGVARTLATEARTTDVVGRLGGEEFVVICEGTDVAGAVAGAERMRMALKRQVFTTEKGPLSVTSSFGVALWQPDETGHDVLARADQALYRAKQQGRDRVVS